MAGRFVLWQSVWGCPQLAGSHGKTKHCAGGTLLDGALVDQSALYGLISKARDLALTLIAVNAMAAKPPDQQRSSIAAATNERGIA